MARTSFIASLALAGCLAACSSPKSGVTGMTPPGRDAGTPAPFQPDPPAVYVAKVKNLLVGLPPTDQEVTAVAADPSQLKTQYSQEMLRFFELAFQQTQISTADFADQAYPKQIAINGTITPLLMQNLQESFARTVLQLVADGKPLSDAMTTRTFMMTTALKELYAFLDAWQVDDAGKVTDRFKAGDPKLQITASTASGPIPISDTLDPASANYMHWYNPDVATADASVAGCQMDPIVFPPSAFTLHWLLQGSLDNHKLADGTSCPQVSGSSTAPQLSPADFADWTMVAIRAPGPGEATTTFYDLPALRSASTLVLSIPRVGFFSTPAFFANWQTNTSNQMRVTMNQALIVALGASVDGSDPTTPPQPAPGLDTTHAQDAACLACHRTLDPLRSIFSASYSWNYHNQLDATWAGQPGLFVFQGVTQPVTTVADLGAALATHPMMPAAWVQKQVTLMSLNVFGRTPGPANTDGRQHNPNHQVSFTIGKPFKGGVIGGVAPVGNDYGATAIDAATGAASRSGDVTALKSLASFGQTMLAAVGVPPATLTADVTTGKVVTGALA